MPAEMTGGPVTLNSENTENPELTEVGAVTTEMVRECQDCIEQGHTDRLVALAGELHAADLGALFELLNKQDRVDLAEAIKSVLDPEVFTELEGAAFDDVIGVLEPAEVAEAITELETDDAVYVLEEIEDEAEQQEVLNEIDPKERVIIEESLNYPEDSAGRLMQRDLVAVPPHWSVEKTIKFMRAEKELPDDFFEIFVVDPKHKPVGTVPLSRLLRAKPGSAMEKLMDEEQTLIPVDVDQEEVAYAFRQYNLVSAAVVDDDGRLVGMITGDDIMDVIDEEAEEDILAMAGVSEGDVNVSVREITKTRFVWLVVNLATAIMASYVISFFEASIEKLVALAVLMPIVASMGGNAGSQTMTVAVRAIAMRELTGANLNRVLTKEVLGALVNGFLLALLSGTVALLWFDSLELGLVIGAAMVINLFVAGLSGILIPMILEKLNFDPAVGSTVVVTTITDVIGFFAFLGLAALFLI